MTTLVLGTAGAIIGNALLPGIGGSLGFMAGSLIGGLIDPPKSEGPRLSDLKLQRASYGAVIPFIWGKGRLAGIIIDQTDLEEHAHKSGGKGGPQVTNYTYTASFDILLCETTAFGDDAIVGCSRIWWNANLYWSADSGLPMPCTLYVGSETQMPDPTFEAVHSPDPVPAYRGFAHAVFTDLDLTQGGNSIGNWEFELYTVGQATVPIHELAANHSEPIIYEWDLGGVGTPIITSWDGWDNTNSIRIRDSTNNDVHIYNNNSGLAWTDTEVAGDGDGYPAYILLESDTTPFPNYVYDPIGYYVYSNGTRIPVWVCQALPISNGYSSAMVTVIAPYIVSGSLWPSPNDMFLMTAGLDPARYLGGCSLSENGRIMLVFTAPTTAVTGHAVIDRWHKIIDGVMVAEGDVIPNLTTYSLGFSSQVPPDTPGPTGIHPFEVNALENSGEYMWYFYAPADEIGVYSFDGSTFRRDPVSGGDVSLFGESVAHFFYKPGIRIIQPGIAGLVGGATLAVWSRLGNASEGVPLSTIVGQLSDMTPVAGSYDVTELTDIVRWYVVASQMTARNAIQPLRQAFFFDAVESDDIVKFRKRELDSELSIPDDDLCAHAYGDDPGTPLKTIRKKETDLPRLVSFNYINVDADYQPGVESSIRQVTRSESDVTVQVPVGFTSVEAAQRCESLQASEWLERETFEWSTSRKWAKLEPCDVVTVRGRVIRIQTRTEQPNGVIKFTGALADPSIYTQTTTGSGSGAAEGGSGGFVPQQPPPPNQLTSLILLDVPIIANPAQQSVYRAAMNGASRPQWAGASLQRSTDGGTTYSEIASSIVPDITGVAAGILGDFDGGNVFDETNDITVTVWPGGGELESVSRLAVLNGANQALLGAPGRWEIFQYRTATLVSDSIYLLSGLLRGRNGTEWARATHTVGDTFVAIPPTLELTALGGDYGIERQYKAVTFGQTLASATTQNFTPLGVALTPYSPVHLGAGRNAAGDWILTWTRRARVNGSWQNFVDVPLDESTEFYKIYLYTDGTYSTIITDRLSPVPTLTLTVAAQTAIYGSPQSILYWLPAQMGALGPGYDPFGNSEILE